MRNSDRRRGSAESSRAFLLIALLLFCTSGLQAQEAGTAEAHSTEISLDLVVDGNPAGSIDALVRSGNGDGRASPEIRVAELAERLEGYLDRESVLFLSALSESSEYVPLAELEAIDLSVGYNQSSLSLRIDVPLDRRTRRRVELARRSSPYSEPILRPARISGAITLRGVIEVDAFPDQDALFDADLTPAGFVNLNGWVLEASAALDSIGRAELERVGLTRDLPEHQARLFVGQFSAPSSAFSNGAGPLNGIALASRTGFEPQVRRKTPESINLRLESPAELVFNVNDERARSLELASGLYSVYGLPLRSGINRVRVEDSEGAETYFEGFVPFDRRFLAPGERDFASFIGFPDGRPEVVGLGFFAEYGITDSLLLSIDNQSSLDGLLVELSTLLGTRFGILNVGSGYSYLRDADPALSGRLAYTFSPEWVPGVSAGLGFGVDQSGFGSPFRASAADESRYSVNAGLTFALPLGFGLQVSGGHRAPLGSIEGSTTLVATLSRTFDRSLQLRLSSSLRTSPEDEPAISLRVSIRETGSERPYDLSTKYSVDEGTASAGLRGRIDRALSTTYYSVDIDGLPVSPAEEPLGLSAQVSHRRSRFDLSGRHSVSEPLLEGGRRGYTGRFEASTALLFADGAFAIGPSIRDSFALIASGESLDGARVILGDRGESRPSASGALGAAIATSLQSYEYNRIDVDVPEAPVTANLGRLSYTLVPTYRSGTLITVDAAPDITLGFRITDRNGNPIPLHAGELAAVEGGRHAPFFSDEAGFVEVYGLDPGNYRALLYDGRRAAEPIRVGPGDSGEVNLGSIQMITEEAE